MDLECEKKLLVENLIRWGYLHSPEIIEAFRRVPRHEFVPQKIREESYKDYPLPIGYGQTIHGGVQMIPHPH